MTARKCDRCGGFYENYTTIGKNATPNSLELIMRNPDGSINVIFKNVDLCPECMNKLMNFLNKED